MLHVATDHEGYAEAIAEVLAAEPRLENLHAPAAWRAELPARCATAYELRMAGAGPRLPLLLSSPRVGFHGRLTPLRVAHRVGTISTRPMSERANLKDYPIEALRERLARDGIEPYRAEQIAGWLYQRGVDDPAAMSDLARRPARASRGGVGDARARGREGRALLRRNREGDAGGARRRAHRVRADPRGGPHHAVRLHPARLPARVQLLRHRRARLRAQPDDRARSSIRSAACASCWIPGGASPTWSSWGWASRC